MTAKAVVDRFEGEVAVLENLETGDFLDVPRSRLPPGTRSGDHLRLSTWAPEAGIEQLAGDAEAARARVRERQRRLRDRSRGDGRP